MTQIRKDLFRCGDGRMIFSVRDCDNVTDMLNFIEKGGGLAIRSDDSSYDGDGGPYTISLVSMKNLDECSSREAFSSEFILMCCLKNTILPLKNYWLKRSERFNADFDPQDVLLQRISWLDAESRFSNINNEEVSLSQTSISQPTVKIERLEISRVRTPPLFSEDELSQKTSVIVPINGLIPIIQLERVDQSEVMEQCLQLWKKTNESFNLQPSESLVFKKKPLTVNPPVVTLPLDGDSSVVESSIEPKNRNQKRKFEECNGSTDSEASASHVTVKELTKHTEISPPKRNRVQKQAHRKIFKRVVVASSSSDTDVDEPVVTQPKKMSMRNGICESTNNNQDKGFKTKNLPIKVNEINTAVGSSGGKEKASCDLIIPKTKRSSWPQTFSSEVIKFVETSSSESSSSPIHKLRISFNKRNFLKREQQKFVSQKSKSRKQILTGNEANIQEESPCDNDVTENFRLRLDDSPPEPEENSRSTNSIECNDFSMQCSFEEPLCEDVSVQTMPTEVVSLDCVSTDLLHYPKCSNQSKESDEMNQEVLDSTEFADFLCQTDFEEPVLCDQICQTEAVIIQPISIDGSMISLENHSSIENNEAGPSTSAKSSSSKKLFNENGMPNLPENVLSRMASYSSNCSDSSGEASLNQNQALIDSKSTFQGKKSKTIKKDSPSSALTLSSDSCVEMSPKSPRISISKKFHPRSSDRSTRSSQRKETRLFVRSRKKHYR